MTRDQEQNILAAARVINSRDAINELIGWVKSQHSHRFKLEATGMNGESFNSYDQISKQALIAGLETMIEHETGRLVEYMK